MEEMDNEKKRTARGVSTSDLVMSAYVSGNADVFPKILSLYVPEGSVIADVTYGKGVFWRNVDESKYHLIKSDAQMGVDARDLPYEDGSLDALVLDPPYMEGFYRRRADHQGGQGSHSAFSDYYNHLAAMGDIEGRPKYHDAVLDVYYRSGEEAVRVLKEGGIFIVKCQDEVSANQQRLTHVEIINYYSSLGFIPEDIFVVVRTNKPSVSRLLKQAHARKNHSYFVIMRKDAQKASKQFDNLRRVLSELRREGGERVMDAESQLCGLCTHFREVGGGTCLVYGTNVSADGHHVNLRSAITGEDHGCEDFMTPEADDEWCRALERAERHPVPWR